MDAIKNVYVSTKSRVEKEIAHFGTTSDQVLETRHLEKLDAILDAVDLKDAERLSVRAFDSVHMTLLSLWATKRIQGPATSANFEAKAKKAEGFVKLNEKKGNIEAAERQRQRVTEFRGLAQKAREGTLGEKPKKVRRRNKTP
jgi:hypothetical protein